MPVPLRKSPMSLGCLIYGARKHTGGQPSTPSTAWHPLITASMASALGILLSGSWS